ncbi:MAG TPA: M56 family metallopeptidase [Vicinamibacterales bacterium]|nr:M56 family metallopeptidase [Vicinamibacterales bacterium]
MTPWTFVIGRTLVDFVWQGTVIGVTAALALRLLRRRAPHVRYLAACVALGVMTVAPLATLSAGLRDGTPAWAIAITPRVVAGSVAALPIAVTDAAADIAAQAAALPFTPAPPERIWSVIVGMWLGGVLLLLGRLGLGWMHVRRLALESRRQPASIWARTADRLARRLGLARAIHVIDSPAVDAPVVIGWLRPVVLLPIAALATLTTAQVEAILAHELAHVRRHDFLVNVVQACVETLFFYHPAVWWLSSRIRIEREQCCDDVAVEVCGDAAAYAEALVQLAAAGTSPSFGIAATGGLLLDRVRRVLRLEPATTRRRSIAAFGLVAALAVAVVLLIVLRTEAIARAASDDDAAWKARLAELHRIVPDFRTRTGPGPQDVNRLMHFNLFPAVVPFPQEDPRDARAWAVTVDYPGGEMAVKGFTARALVRWAYGLGDAAVVDVPGWMDDRSVALTARTPAASPDTPDVLLAIRLALEAQWHVRLRHETRDYPVYALVLSNTGGALGPNIRPARPGACVTAEAMRDGAMSGRRDFRGRPSCGVDGSLTGPTAHGATIQEIARAIERPWLDRPVVDRTGLEGRFDAQLELGLVPLSVIASVHPDATPVVESLGVRSMQRALPEQLGLTLEPSTASYDVVAVEATR